MYLQRIIIAAIIALTLVGCEDPGALRTSRTNTAPITQPSNTESVPEGTTLRDILPAGTQGFKQRGDLFTTPLGEVTYDLDHCEDKMCLITVTSGEHAGEQYWIQEANRYRFN